MKQQYKSKQRALLRQYEKDNVDPEESSDEKQTDRIYISNYEINRRLKPANSYNVDPVLREVN